MEYQSDWTVRLRVAGINDVSTHPKLNSRKLRLLKNIYFIEILKQLSSRTSKVLVKQQKPLGNFLQRATMHLQGYCLKDLDKNTIQKIWELEEIWQRLNTPDNMLLMIKFSDHPLLSKNIEQRIMNRL